MNPLIGSVLLATLKQLATSGGLKLAKTWWTSSETDRAIVQVDLEFAGQDIEGVSDHLRRWVTSATFQARLACLERGELPSQSEITDLIGSLDLAALYTGPSEESAELADRILARFFTVLFEEYLKSSDGLVYQTRFMDLRLREIMEAVRERNTQFPQPQLANLTRLNEMGSPTPDSEIEPSVLRDYETVQSLIRANNIDSALRWLEQRKKSQGSARSIDEQYQWHATRGLALRQRNEHGAALGCFESAERLKPSRLNAVGNTALALLDVDKLDRSVAKADQILQYEPNHATAIIAKSQALAKLDRLEEAIELAARISDSMARHHLRGILYLNSHRFDDAITHLESAHEASDSAEITFQLSQAYLGRFQATINDQGLAPWSAFPPQATQDLARGTGLLSEAIETARKLENRVLLGTMLLSKVSLLAFQKDTEALPAFEEAGRYGAHDANAITGVVLLLMSTGDERRALQILADEHAVQTADLIRLRVQLLESIEGHDAAVTFLHTSEVVRILGSKRANVAAAECFLDKGDREEAANLLESLPHDPNDWETAIVLSRLRFMQQKTDEAVAILQDAIAVAEPSLAWRLRLTLAHLYSSADRWEQAAETLGNLVTPRSPSALLRQYLVALERSDDLPKFFEFAKRVRAERGLIAECAGPEAQLLAGLGRLDEADAILGKLMEADPKNTNWAYQRAIIAHRKGDTESARELVPNAESASRLPVSAAMAVAGIHVELGQYREALETGYLSLRSNPNEAEAHLRYVGLCLAIPEAEITKLEPTEVVQGSFVLIDDDGAKREIEIVGADQQTLTDDQERITGPFGQKLLGRKGGDVVRLREDEYGAQEVSVLSISSKYAAICRRVFEKFHTRFPENMELRRFRFGAAGLQPFLQAMDRRASWVDEMKKGYQEQPLPMSTLAQIAHDDEIAIWYALVSGNFGRVYASPGAPAATVAAGEVATTKRAIALDPTSICALQELQLLEELPRLGVRMLVSQSTIDLLNHARLEARRPVSMTVGKHGDEYFRQDVTAEDRERIERLWTSTIGWIRQNCEVTGVAIPDGVRYKRLTSILLPASADTIVLAMHEQAVLISEDARLRGYSLKEHRIMSCTVADLSLRLRDAGHLEHDRYDDLVVRLIQWGYFFVSVSPPVLRSALRLDGWNPGRHVNTVLESLKDPSTVGLSAAPVLAKFLKLIWRTGDLLEQRRRLLLFSCFDVLASKPNYRQVRNAFLATIRREFEIDYLGCREIEQTLVVWSRMRLLPE